MFYPIEKNIILRLIGTKFFKACKDKYYHVGEPKIATANVLLQVMLESQITRKQIKEERGINKYLFNQKKKSHRY